MTAETKTISSRDQNRAERQERRDLIVLNWNRRAALRQFTREFKEDSTNRTTLAGLLHFKRWAFTEDLLREVQLSPDAALYFIAYLVRVIQQKEMPYDEYLRTEEWQARATAAKARYGGRCALDDDHPAEHAHHRTYERRGRELPDDLVPLCADCHAKFHGRR